MAREGIADSRENALTYLRKNAQGQGEERLIETFADVGPEMAVFVEEHTDMEWGVFSSLVPWAVENCTEYHPEWPGAVPIGRSLRPVIDGQPGGGPELTGALLRGAGIALCGFGQRVEVVFRRIDDRQHAAHGVTAKECGRRLGFLLFRQMGEPRTNLPHDLFKRQHLALGIG